VRKSRKREGVAGGDAGPAPSADDVGWMACGSAARPTDDLELRRMRAASYLRGKDVLDIGTGDGRLAWLIAPSARSVVGIDPDAAVIREARRGARARGVRSVRFMVRPAQDLRVGREAFDTAVFSWSL